MEKETLGVWKIPLKSYPRPQRSHSIEILEGLQLWKTQLHGDAIDCLLIVKNTLYYYKEKAMSKPLKCDACGKEIQVPIYIGETHDYPVCLQCFNDYMDFVINPPKTRKRKRGRFY